MNRIDYHQSLKKRIVAAASGVLAGERLRVPVAAIGAALIAITATWSLETHRISALDAELTALQARIVAARAGDARAERLSAAVVRLRALNRDVALARREAVIATNTVARIGNDLPPQTWLTQVGSTSAGTWTIDGRSTRVDEIGTMLRRVQSIDRGVTPRLISIAATGRAGRVLDFVIGWDRRS